MPSQQGLLFDSDAVNATVLPDTFLRYGVIIKTLQNIDIDRNQYADNIDQWIIHADTFFFFFFFFGGGGPPQGSG